MKPQRGVLLTIAYQHCKRCKVIWRGWIELLVAKIAYYRSQYRRMGHGKMIVVSVEEIIPDFSTLNNGSKLSSKHCNFNATTFFGRQDRVEARLKLS